MGLWVQNMANDVKEGVVLEPLEVRRVSTLFQFTKRLRWKVAREEIHCTGVEWGNGLQTSA